MKKLVVILMFLMFLFVSCKTVKVYDDQKQSEGGGGRNNIPPTQTQSPE